LAIIDLLNAVMPAYLNAPKPWQHSVFASVLERHVRKGGHSTGRQ
jgi:hypothetical protein